MSAANQPSFRFDSDAVLFDLDGTLVDSSHDIAHSVNFALTSVGLTTHSIEEIRSFIGRGTKSLIRRILHGRDELFEPAFSIFSEHYRVHLLDETRLYPGVDRVLDALGDKHLAVISNKRQDFCDLMIDGLGLRDRFFEVMGGDRLPNPKPHPDPLHFALKKVGVSVDRAVMIGDSSIDIQAGKAAGTRTIGLTGGFCAQGEIEEASPDLILPRLSELQSFLKAPLQG